MPSDHFILPILRAFVDSSHSFRTLNPKEPTMTIEIRDAALEARIRKQLQATGSSSVEEVLLRCRLSAPE